MLVSELKVNEGTQAGSLEGWGHTGPAASPPEILSDNSGISSNRAIAPDGSSSSHAFGLHSRPMHAEAKDGGVGGSEAKGILQATFMYELQHPNGGLFGCTVNAAGVRPFKAWLCEYSKLEDRRKLVVGRLHFGSLFKRSRARFPSRGATGMSCPGPVHRVDLRCQETWLA
eukprot:jgi/Botrbrau1/19845/Bobra.0124s0081.1